MKFSIHKDCFDTLIKRIDKKGKKSNIPIEIKRHIAYKIIDNIKDERELDFIIKDLCYVLTPKTSSYRKCSQCGDENSHEEFEI